MIGPIYRLYDNEKHGLDQSSWPPKSRENWMEVMVVADGKMVSYHGDHLEVKHSSGAKLHAVLPDSKNIEARI